VIDNGLTLVGGRVADWSICDRVRPGRRWLYVLVHASSGDIKRLRGHEVVRLVRQARLHGLAVQMPRMPWRDEDVA
jgi:hypothetical protein